MIIKLLLRYTITHLVCYRGYKLSLLKCPSSDFDLKGTSANVQPMGFMRVMMN